MISLKNILSNKGNEAYISERIQRYENRTLAFIFEQFPHISDNLNEEDIRKVIKLSYYNAKKRGIRSEQNHWKYLTCVVFWGSFFETDPQHIISLHHAGWFDENGRRINNSHPTPVLRKIDEWFVVTGQDIKNTKHILFESISRLLKSRRNSITYDDAIKEIATVWPKKNNVLGKDFIRFFVEKNYHIANQKGYKGDKICAYMIVAIYLGYRFDEDPLYPKVSNGNFNFHDGDIDMIFDTIKEKNSLYKGRKEFL